MDDQVSTQPTEICDGCKHLTGGAQLTATIFQAYYCLADVPIPLPTWPQKSGWPINECDKMEEKDMPELNLAYNIETHEITLPEKMDVVEMYTHAKKDWFKSDYLIANASFPFNFAIGVLYVEAPWTITNQELIVPLDVKLLFLR